MEQKKIDRINELAHLAKARELTEEELAERAVLRAEYIADFRRATINVLENTYIVDEKGNKRKLPGKMGGFPGRVPSRTHREEPPANFISRIPQPWSPGLRSP